MSFLPAVPALAREGLRLIAGGLGGLLCGSASSTATSPATTASATAITDWWRSAAGRRTRRPPGLLSFGTAIVRSPCTAADCLRVSAGSPGVVCFAAVDLQRSWPWPVDCQLATVTCARWSACLSASLALMCSSAGHRLAEPAASTPVQRRQEAVAATGGCSCTPSRLYWNTYDLTVVRGQQQHRSRSHIGGRLVWAVCGARSLSNWLVQLDRCDASDRALAQRAAAPAWTAISLHGVRA